MKITHRHSKIKLKRAMIQVKFVLAQEKLETRQMLVVYRRYTLGQASKDELKVANRQFVDVLKGIGLGVFAILPFAPITIPVAVKLGQYVGVDILPSAVSSYSEQKKAGITPVAQVSPLTSAQAADQKSES